MTDLRQAAQQTLEALETLKIALRVGMPEYGAEDQDELLETATTALRAALMSVTDVAEQPAKAQKPKPSDIFCGVDFEGGVLAVSVLRRRPDALVELLHFEQIELTAPQPRQEVELTDEAITHMAAQSLLYEENPPQGFDAAVRSFARAVIEAYKAKQGETK